MKLDLCKKGDIFWVGDRLLRIAWIHDSKVAWTMLLGCGHRMRLGRLGGERIMDADGKVGKVPRYVGFQTCRCRHR